MMKFSPVRLPILEVATAAAQDDHIRSVCLQVSIPVVMSEKTSGDLIRFKEGEEFLLPGEPKSRNDRRRRKVKEDEDVLLPCRLLRKDTLEIIDKRFRPF